MNGFINYATWALTGAAKLARFDASGVSYFDVSIAGFWRSFWAAVIVAPFFGMLLILRHLDAGSAGVFLHHLSIEFLTYVIAWVLFPLVMVSVTRMLGCTQHFISFVVAYNWCGVIQNGVYLPIAIFAHTGALSPGTANGLGLVAIAWVLAFTFFVARTTLKLPAGTAFAIVVLDLVLGLILDTVSNRFM
jgi:hypothetical protein